ncbi:MAG: YraN family protein [Alphaproteobacteria bacterium]
MNRAARGAAARRRGARAERIAALVLRLKGYAILARGHRAPQGEIDIVARRGRVLAFVEVKARRDADLAAHALQARQRARIARAAAGFLAARPGLAGLEPRFDAMVFGAWPWPRHVVDAWRDSP